jgi:hypothetical protein
MVQNITVQTTPGGFFGGLMGLGHGFMLGSMIMSGLRGLFGGFFGGGMGGFGMGGINPNMSMSYPSLGGLTGTTPLSTQNANGNDKQAKDLAKLNSMYGAKGFHIVPNDDGTFSATDKDCKNVAMNKTFEEMCEILGGEPQGDGGSGKVSVKAEDDLSVNNPNGNGTGKVTDDQSANTVTGKDNSKVSREEAHNPGSTDGPDKTHSSRNTSRTDKTNGSGNTGKTNKKEWSAAEKAKPRRLQMTVSLSAWTHQGSGIVVAPDGKSYKFQIGAARTSAEALNNLANKIKHAMSKDGWTNVILENKQFGWSTDGSEAVGKVEKPKGADAWTKEKREKYSGTVKIAFSLTNRGVDGSATVVTPDGKVHQVNYSNKFQYVAIGNKPSKEALKELLGKMQKELKKEGNDWANIKLTYDTDHVGKAAFED